MNDANQTEIRKIVMQMGGTMEAAEELGVPESYVWNHLPADQKSPGPGKHYRSSSGSIGLKQFTAQTK